MAKAIFTTKPQSIYDDDISNRYHFPRTYLRQVQEAIDDFIVFYEPRRQGLDDSGRLGRQAYFAVARVLRVEADPANVDHFYAYLSDYLPFDQPVPFKVGPRYFESRLEKSDGSTNKGAFGRSVRLLPLT
jgi:putative restriction endonuclease